MEAVLEATLKSRQPHTGDAGAQSPDTVTTEGGPAARSAVASCVEPLTEASCL